MNRRNFIKTIAAATLLPGVLVKAISQPTYYVPYTPERSQIKKHLRRCADAWGGWDEVGTVLCSLRSPMGDLDGLPVNQIPLSYSRIQPCCMPTTPSRCLSKYPGGTNSLASYQDGPRFA